MPSFLLWQYVISLFICNFLVVLYCPIIVRIQKRPKRILFKCPVSSILIPEPSIPTRINFGPLYYFFILACENDDNLKTLEEFKGTVGGLERAITDLINTMANSPQSYKDLGSELESMMTTIDELVQVKQCDFISQEYAKITRKKVF